MDVITFFRALKKRIWILVLVPLISIVAAVILTMDYKKMFKSTAHLATGFTIKQQVSLSDDKFSLYEADVKFNNVIETLTSQKVMGLLSYRLMLHDLGSNNPFRKLEEDKIIEVKNLINIDETLEIFQMKVDSLQLLSSFDEKEKKLIELIKIYKYDSENLNKTLNISRVNRTDYISILFFSENPELSAFVVNTICKEFLSYYNSLYSQRTVESVETFSDLVQKKQEALSQKEEELRMFKSTERVINLEAESTSKIDQIAEFEKLLEEEKKSYRGFKYSLEDVNKRLKEKGNSVVSNSIDNSNLNTKIVNLRKRINILNQAYISGGSSDSNLRSQIEILREELRSEISTLNANNTSVSTDPLSQNLIERKQTLEMNMEVSRQNMDAIESQIKLYRNNFVRYASKEARIASLQREVQRLTEEYLSAQEKYNTALNLSFSTGDNIKQTLDGQLAVEPEPSKRLIISGLSGITSLTLCILVIVLLEYLDVSIKTPSYFSKVTNLKLIGILNQIELKNLAVIKDIFMQQEKDISKSVMRELLRKLRYELEKSNKKVFLFTSTKSGEGKSFLIHALASTFSLIKKKVLIIDTNFSNNSLTQIFNADRSLESFITSVNLQEKKGFRTIINQTSLIGVDIIGCRGGNYSPAEIFPKNNIFKYLLSINEEYDYIFLEGGSLNDKSDTKELLEYVDVCIAVFSAKSVIKQMDKDSISFLDNLNNKFLGGVLNNVDLENIDQ